MPFGLTNTPSTFLSLINEIMKPYLRKFVLVFFDDMLVYGLNEEVHLSHLKAVLQTLREHTLFINNKCSFGQPSLEYLRHMILAEGVGADPKKIEAAWSCQSQRT